MFLYRNDTLLTEVKRSVTDPNGIFQTDKDLKPFTEGATYKIRVTAPGFETIEAEQKVPNFVPIKKITFKRSSYTKSDGGKLSEILIDFDDPVETEDFYAVSIIVEGIDGAFYSWNRANQNVFALDPLATSAFTINDRSFNGQRHSWAIGLDGVDTSNIYSSVKIIYVNFRTVNKDFEKYRRSTELIDQLQSNPYIEPYTIYTNVKNGYGLFNINGKVSNAVIKLR